VQEDVCVALCALLHQLFDKRNHLFERHAPKFIKAHGTELKSDFEALWELFEQVIADPDMGNVVCLLDALDECATKYRQSLISKIERLLSTRGADDFPPKPDLKFLLATRPYASVTGSFSRLSVGDVSSLLDGTKEQHRISGEIDEVIKAELGAYGRSLCLTVEQIRSATSTLLEYRNRTYLWVKFILEEIRLANPATPSEFADVVSRLPRSVEDAYEKMLSRCQNRGRAIAILAILLAARRAFSLEEIDVLLALHVEPKPASYNDLQHNLAGPNVRAAQVREQCGLFVVVVDCKLHLIHQTAYEFLLRSHSAPRPDEGWKHLLHAPETHEFLCGACIWFLLFPEFTLSRLDLASDRPVLTSKVEQILNQNGDTFLRYACTYWATHFIESRSKAFDPLTEWARTLYHPPEGRTRIWHHIYSRFQTSRRKSSCDSDPGLQPGTPFELICCYGHCAVLKLIGTSSATMTLLQRGLYHASRNGHVDVVNWLLQAGANVNATINDGPTPLQAAARLGRYRVSKALLANGADMGHPGGPTGWGSALHIALREGNVQLATTMLRQSPDVCAASAKYRSALHAAAGCLRHGSGHLEIFRQCMELGIDVNCHDSDRNTALHLLAELGGQPEKVEQLLASGADLSMVNAQGQTPLCIVVARLYLEQVLSTIDNEDPNSSKASKRSRTEIPLKAADTIRLVSCHFTTLLPSILAQLRTDVMATEASILQVYNELALSLRPSAEFNRPRSWDVAARLGLFQLVKFWPSLEVESDEAAATAVIKFDDVLMTEFPAIVAFCSDEMECNICHAKNMLSGGHCPFCRRSGLYICENCIAHDGGCPEGHVLRSYRLELAPKELLDLLLTDEGEQYFRTSAKMSSDTLKYWGHDSVN
jgi:ankyrin repeat protein